MSAVTVKTPTPFEKYQHVIKLPILKLLEGYEAIFHKIGSIGNANLDPFGKGYAFERFIVSSMRIGEEYTLLAWQSDKSINGVYPILSLDPYFVWLYQNRDVAEMFAIECKWRANYFDDGIEWAKPEQFESYIEFEEAEEIPVTIAIGVGGQPDRPQDLYLIPLKEIKYNFLYRSILNNYKKNGANSNLKFNMRLGRVI